MFVSFGIKCFQLLQKTKKSNTYNFKIIKNQHNLQKVRDPLHEVCTCIKVMYGQNL